MAGLNTAWGGLEATLQEAKANHKAASELVKKIYLYDDITDEDHPIYGRLINISNKINEYLQICQSLSKKLSAISQLKNTVAFIAIQINDALSLLPTINKPEINAFFEALNLNIHQYRNDLIQLAEKTRDDYFKHHRNQNLADWLTEKLGDQALDTKIYKEANEIIIEMALSQHGRLFLQALQNNLSELLFTDTKTTLSPLIDLLACIEAAKTPTAHFIWIGPPSNTLKELAGIRSLRAITETQPIHFWINDAFIETYTAAIKRLRLKDIKLISVEKYAKKACISFGDGHTLLEQINYFYTLSNQKVEANKKIDGIQDRITIVNYLKATIPLYEGGYIFDADVLFHANCVDPEKNFLQHNAQAIFPLHHFGTDVWFFYTNPVLTYDKQLDLPEALTEKDNLEKRSYTRRRDYLETYHNIVCKQYKERGEATLSTDFSKAMGSAILGIAGSKAERRKETATNPLNCYLPIEPLKHVAPSEEQNPDQAYALAIRSNAHTLSLSEGCTLFKFYNQSYIADKDHVAYVFHLLYINKGKIFSDFLTQAQKYLNINMLAKSDIKLTEYKFTESGKHIGLDLILTESTAFHIALIARPDLFLTLLETLSIKELDELLLSTIQLPMHFFNAPSSSISSNMNLFELANNLLQHYQARCNALQLTESSLYQYYQHNVYLIQFAYIETHIFKTLNEIGIRSRLLSRCNGLSFSTQLLGEEKEDVKQHHAFFPAAGNNVITHFLSIHFEIPPTELSVKTLHTKIAKSLFPEDQDTPSTELTI